MYTHHITLHSSTLLYVTLHYRDSTLHPSIHPKVRGFEAKPLFATS